MTEDDPNVVKNGGIVVLPCEQWMDAAFAAIGTVSDDVCPNCGQSLAIGDWPFCPHGRGTYGAQADDIPGGETLENVGPAPVTFYSRSEKRRYLKEHGLVEMVRHVPVPGTDKSPHTTSWAAVDLDAGRILAERQAHTKASAPEYRANPENIAAIKEVYERHYAQNGRH